MSLERIGTVFDHIGNCVAWQLQLLRIKTSKKNGTHYAGRTIALLPEGKLTEFVINLSNQYMKSDGGIFHNYSNVSTYDGTAESTTIYRLCSDNQLIHDELAALIAALATPDSEADPLDFSANAYVLQGVVALPDEEVSTKLISMKRPIVRLKHKFLHDNGAFREIDDSVLSLRPFIDVVILDHTVYLLTMAGEKLFNMERSYRAVCADKVLEIIQSNIITDEDEFKRVASTGYNPRKFVAYNTNRMQYLANPRQRANIANKFSIPLIDGRFDTKQKDVSEKLIKLLCNKGMVDPFEDLPVEVTGAKKWQ